MLSVCKWDTSEMGYETLEAEVVLAGQCPGISIALQTNRAGEPGIQTARQGCHWLYSS